MAPNKFTKHQYEKAFRDSEYINFECKFNKTITNQTKRNWEGNITWFNQAFNRVVSQMFKNCFFNYYLTPYHPQTNFKKIFDKNTMKFSCCCTQSLANIIKLHNKMLNNTSVENTLPCNSRKKHDYPLSGKCRAENIV